MFSFVVDDEARAIRVTSAGVWSPADVDAYADAFARHAAVARERFGTVRVLIDASEAPPRGMVTMGRLKALGALLDRPGDRMAVVAVNGDVKHDARDGMPPHVMAFLTRRAAEAWLFAYDQRRVAARQDSIAS